jgi:hypothetical protein
MQVGFGCRCFNDLGRHKQRLLCQKRSAVAEPAWTVVTCKASTQTAGTCMTRGAIACPVSNTMSIPQGLVRPLVQPTCRYCLYTVCPAGVGSVLTASGLHELEASVMSSSGSACGAVALIKRVANPIVLARHVSDAVVLRYLSCAVNECHLEDCSNGLWLCSCQHKVCRSNCSCVL